MSESVIVVKKMEKTVHNPKAAKPEQMIPLGDGDFKAF